MEVGEQSRTLQTAGDSLGRGSSVWPNTSVHLLLLRGITVLCCAHPLLEFSISCQPEWETEFPGGYCLFNSVGLLLFYSQCLNKPEYTEATAVYPSSPRFTVSELSVASPFLSLLSLNWPIHFNDNLCSRKKKTGSTRTNPQMPGQYGPQLYQVNTVKTNKKKSHLLLSGKPMMKQAIFQRISHLGNSRVLSHLRQPLYFSKHSWALIRLTWAGGSGSQKSALVFLLYLVKWHLKTDRAIGLMVILPIYLRAIHTK